jgi:hypothetical protein
MKNFSVERLASANVIVNDVRSAIGGGEAAHHATTSQRSGKDNNPIGISCLYGTSTVKCDLCGRNFTGKASVDTRSVGTSGKYHGNQTAMFVMCPACKKRRDLTHRFLAMGLLIFIIVLFLMGLALR